ncbi:MAG: Rnase Y domain-containing protein [Candidatus Adiutrix sp.]|nr:Rnase Y domain-containing protein [Candidatus Adiutrix sp.]
MNGYIIWALSGLGVLPLGILIGFWWRKKIFESKLENIETLSRKMIEEAQRDVVNIKKEATLQGQDIIFQMKAAGEKELLERKREQKKQEERLNQKEEHYDRRAEQLAQREAAAARQEAELVKAEKKNQAQAEDLAQLAVERHKALEKAASLTAAEAKELLLKNMEEEARHAGARLIRLVETETRETADKKAREILALAVKRYAGDYVAEHTISVVPLPNDEMKGRIIGR